MKAVLISIQPKWVEKIANGEKTIEVRKTAPKCEVPFKCYIYATKKARLQTIFKKGEWIFSDDHSFGKFDENIFVKDSLCAWQGKIIGEFVCDKVFLLHPYTYDGGNADRERRKLIQTFEGSSKENEILAATCLTQDEMFDYIGAGNYGYGWHISDLKIYDKPKELSEFKKTKERIAITCGMQAGNGLCRAIDYEELCDNIKCCFKTPCPPQSWCYVEEIEE